MKKILIISQVKIFLKLLKSKFCILNEYTGYNDDILGIEKIKIPDKSEYIISYNNTSIKIWQ